MTQIDPRLGVFLAWAGVVYWIRHKMRDNHVIPAFGFFVGGMVTLWTTLQKEDTPHPINRITRSFEDMISIEEYVFVSRAVVLVVLGGTMPCVSPRPTLWAVVRFLLVSFAWIEIIHHSTPIVFAIDMLLCCIVRSATSLKNPKTSRIPWIIMNACVIQWTSWRFRTLSIAIPPGAGQIKTIPACVLVLVTTFISDMLE
jgi:hypothetical protein